jgi:hypothetical protein
MRTWRQPGEIHMKPQGGDGYEDFMEPDYRKLSYQKGL